MGGALRLGSGGGVGVGGAIDTETLCVFGSSPVVVERVESCRVV